MANAFREACVACMRSQVAPVKLLRKGSSDAEFGYRYSLSGYLWICSNAVDLSFTLAGRHDTTTTNTHCVSFTPTFKCLGTIVSWDLREVKDVEARIKSTNKLFGSAKATFWSNARVPFELRMRFYKAIVVNTLLWGCESWAMQSKEVQALRVFQFRCLRTILKINVMHKVSRFRTLEMCQVQDIVQTMDLRRARWIEKLSHMDFTRCPRLLFGCWMYGKVHHRDSKPLKTIGHFARGLSLHKRSRLHFVRGSRGEAARVAEEAKNHFETGRCSDGDGFSARHSSREHGYYEQFRGFRSGPERHYE